jgi:hypothetical protein
VEDLLEGEEVSLLAFCDGVTAKGTALAAQVCSVSSPSLSVCRLLLTLPLPLLLLNH